MTSKILIIILSRLIVVCFPCFTVVANPKEISHINIVESFDTFTNTANNSKGVVIPNSYFKQLKDGSLGLTPVNLIFEIEFINKKNLGGYVFLVKSKRDDYIDISNIVLDNLLEKKLNYEEQSVFRVSRNGSKKFLSHSLNKGNNKIVNIFAVHIPLTHDYIYIENGKLYFELIMENLFTHETVGKFELEIIPHYLNYETGLNCRLNRGKMTLDVKSNVEFKVIVNNSEDIILSNSLEFYHAKSYKAKNEFDLMIIPKFSIDFPVKYIVGSSINRIFSNKKLNIDEKKRARIIKYSLHKRDIVSFVKSRIKKVLKGSYFNGTILIYRIRKGDSPIKIETKINKVIRPLGGKITYKSFYKLKSKFKAGGSFRYDFKDVFNTIKEF